MELRTYSSGRITMGPSIEWKDVNYSIKDKLILDKITGQVFGGELLAILGPSGSGKTSLLNILADRVTINKTAELTGSITICGKDRKELPFKKMVAYVQQEDILYPQMTVFESLVMTSKLRLTSDVNVSTKKEMINNLLNKLGLAKIKDSKIGNVLKRGISGGEKKRTCIANEILTEPLIIFLDEPTSGLDSFQAKNIIQILKDLAEQGHIVICSIHQPSSSVFNLFDKVIFLSNGKCVYSGYRNDCTEYFGDLDFKCPEFYNPADYILDLISLDTTSEETLKESELRIEKLLNLDRITVIDLIHDEEYEYTGPNTGKFFSNWIDQFKLLFIRSLNEELRDKVGMTIRFCVTIFFSIILSMIYSNLDNGQKSIQDTLGVYFFICINSSFGSMFPTLKKFAIEKEIVLKERASKSYQASSFYLAKFLSSVPIEFGISILYTSIIYWAIGLNHSGSAYFSFLVIICCLSLCSSGMGLFLSASTPDIHTATSLASPLMIIFLLFGGFYANLETMPIWIGWLQYFSFINWGFQGLIINEFSGKTMNCNDIPENQACLTTGSEVLSRYSFDRFTEAECILAIFFIGISFHLLAYLSLRRNKPTYQNIESN